MSVTHSQQDTMEAILFRNWTEEDFSHTWDGVNYRFPAGSEMMLQSHLAYHFAKHLATREAHKQGINVIYKSAVIKELVNRCIASDEKIEANSQEELDVKIMNAPACDECQFEAKSEAGLKAHKRSHKKDVPDDDEFEGLKK